MVSVKFAHKDESAKFPTLSISTTMDSWPNVSASGTLDSFARAMPYIGTVEGGALGALGGSAIGGLIQALRRKSILKGLTYGGLTGLGLGGGLGLYRGLQTKSKMLDMD